MKELDIQVGDRVTYIEPSLNKIFTVLIEDERDIKYLKDLKNNKIKILKIERPTYTVVDEKKELLTGEEKEFLKQIIKFSPYAEKITYIEKNCVNFLDFCDAENRCCFDISFKSNIFFNKVVEGKKYTLQELGLEE